MARTMNANIELVRVRPDSAGSIRIGSILLLIGLSITFGFGGFLVGLIVAITAFVTTMARDEIVCTSCAAPMQKTDVAVCEVCNNDLDLSRSA